MKTKAALKKSAIGVAIVSAFALAGIAPAFAGTIGGAVAPINVVTQNDVANITVVADTAQTDTTVVTGTIDNNDAGGWTLTVASANSGKLKKGAGGAGREILYTNVKLVTGTSGTLGTGLTSPAASKDVTSGSAVYAALTTATSATVNYGYALKISWSADTSMLSGDYQDTITVTLANNI
jgi:hypothetical protein